MPSWFSLAQLRRLVTIAQREAWGAEGSFGGACSSFDIPNLACDSRGGFRASFLGRTVGAGVSTIKLRVNGSTANLARTGLSGDVVQAAFTFSDAVSSVAVPNFANGVADGKWFVDVYWPSVKSGRFRSCWIINGALRDPAANTWRIHAAVFTFLSTAEIVSIGVETNVALDMRADSIYTLERVR